jgi:hypothetical protein
MSGAGSCKHSEAAAAFPVCAEAFLRKHPLDGLMLRQSSAQVSKDHRGGFLFLLSAFVRGSSRKCPRSIITRRFPETAGHAARKERFYNRAFTGCVRIAASGRPALGCNRGCKTFQEQS